MSKEACDVCKGSGSIVVLARCGGGWTSEPCPECDAILDDLSRIMRNVPRDMVQSARNRMEARIALTSPEALACLMSDAEGGLPVILAAEQVTALVKRIQHLEERLREESESGFMLLHPMDRNAPIFLVESEGESLWVSANALVMHAERKATS